MKYPILTLFADGGDSGAVGESNAQAGLAEDIKTGDNTESDSCCEYDEDVLEKEFDELIQGKYNKAFTRRTEDIISKRIRAVQGEKSADNTDISLEKIRLTERAARVYAGWERESELLKNEYPDFDLRSEAKNPRFVRLIRAGAGIKEAYEVIHRDSLLSERLKNAVIAEVTKRWNEIEERKSRPDENGITSVSNPVTKRSVASYSKNEREALERRALHGEHIIL